MNPKGTEELTAAKFEAALLLSKHKTFQEWQQATGLPRSTFHSIRSGKRMPSVEVALKIAYAAGVSVETIWGHLTFVEKPKMAPRGRKKSPGAVSAAPSAIDNEQTKTHERRTAGDSIAEG